MASVVGQIRLRINLIGLVAAAVIIEALLAVFTRGAADANRGRTW